MVHRSNWDEQEGCDLAFDISGFLFGDDHLELAVRKESGKQILIQLAPVSKSYRQKQNICLVRSEAKTPAHIEDGCRSFELRNSVSKVSVGLRFNL
jgi:hypothetical protein